MVGFWLMLFADRRGILGGPSYLSSFDADLQVVIAAWDSLPEAIRKAMSTLVRAGE